MPEQELQAIIVEMVQKQIAQEGRLCDLRLSQPFERISRDHFGLPAELAKVLQCPWLDKVHAVEKNDFVRTRLWSYGAGEFEEEGAIAGAELNDGLNPAIGFAFAPGFDEQRHVAH